MINYILTVEELRSYVPGTDVTMDADVIKPYLKVAHKNVADTIGPDVFAEIIKQESAELIDCLKSAVANRIMYDYRIFETIRKRQGENGNTYRYELEMMMDKHLAYFYDAIDSVFRLLNSEDCTVASWKTCDVKLTQESLLLKTTESFNSFYGIDRSDYFYFSTIFLQQAVIDQYVSLEQYATLDTKRQRRFNTIVAKLTVARALRQFDVTMLPKSLRNMSSESGSRRANSEQDMMYELSGRLIIEAERELGHLHAEINAERDDAVNLPGTENLNSEQNKFFHMS